jgi:5'(3')-deoxyribonucleotidase
MPNWEEGNVSFEEIKQKIHKFTEWNSFINQKIKDVPKGCLNINGIKIATKLTSELVAKIEVYRKELSSLMVRRMTETKKTIEAFTKSLEPFPELLKDYGDYIDNYNMIMSKNKALENQKIEIENMQSQLKKLDGSILPENARELQLVK